MEDLVKSPFISIESLSKILGKTVKSFEIKPGTNVGNNYMSVIYALHVEVEEPNAEGKQTISLISKCFPSHPIRQQILQFHNVFYREWKVYDVLIPALREIMNSNGISDALPFSQLVGGNAVDFFSVKKISDTHFADKVYEPFDMFIMMPDLRAYNFRMADRLVGLDLEHTKLIMKSYAKFHSLSWAYKLKHKLDSTEKKFPFLDQVVMGELECNMFKPTLVNGVQIALDIMEPGSKIYERTKLLQENIGEIMRTASGCKIYGDYLKLIYYHRIKPVEPNGPEWKVIIHGDCWVNNMLFRYDEETNLPIELVLLDLQMVKEHCLTADLVYMFYSSTDREFRKQHLNDMLKLYHDEFLRQCTILKIEPLPNFSIVELNRRFHISKIFGYCLATIVLPMLLNDASEIQDMEKMDLGGMGDMFSKIITNKAAKYNTYKDRIIDLAEELFEEGVL